VSTMAAHPQDVAAYLERVRAALADLPPEERDELLADVEASLLDAASDSVVPLAEQLGPPERFAGELRAAAGLAPQAGAPRATEPALQRLVERVRPLLAAGRDLAPVWWALRGYVAVAGLALLIGAGWSTRMPVLPHLAGGRWGDLALVLAAIGLSLWAGRRWGRRMLPVNLVLAAAALPVFVHLSNPPGYEAPYAYYEPYQPPARGLMLGGVNVRNIYAYDRDGTPLYDVRLYTSSGRPLNIGSADPRIDPRRRTITTATGTTALNAFPIRYFEKGTRKVAHPSAGPKVRTPRIITPPLRRTP
jgi:hypothetical protein